MRGSKRKPKIPPITPAQNAVNACDTRTPSATVKSTDTKAGLNTAATPAESKPEMPASINRAFNGSWTRLAMRAHPKSMSATVPQATTGQTDHAPVSSSANTTSPEEIEATIPALGAGEGTILSPRRALTRTAVPPITTARYSRIVRSAASARLISGERTWTLRRGMFNAMWTTRRPLQKHSAERGLSVYWRERNLSCSLHAESWHKSRAERQSWPFRSAT